MDDATTTMKDVETIRPALECARLAAETELTAHARKMAGTSGDRVAVVATEFILRVGAPQINTRSEDELSSASKCCDPNRPRMRHGFRTPLDRLPEHFTRSGLNETKKRTNRGTALHPSVLRFKLEVKLQPHAAVSRTVPTKANRVL